MSGWQVTGKDGKNRMFKKPVICLLLTTLLLLTVSLAEAQQPTKVHRIGYLSAGMQLVSPVVPKECGALSASLAT